MAPPAVQEVPTTTASSRNRSPSPPPLPDVDEDGLILDHWNTTSLLLDNRPVVRKRVRALVDEDRDDYQAQLAQRARLLPPAPVPAPAVPPNRGRRFNHALVDGVMSQARFLRTSQATYDGPLACSTIAMCVAKYMCHDRSESATPLADVELDGQMRLGCMLWRERWSALEFPASMPEPREVLTALRSYLGHALEPVREMQGLVGDDARSVLCANTDGIVGSVHDVVQAWQEQIEERGRSAALLITRREMTFVVFQHQNAYTVFDSHEWDATGAVLLEFTHCADLVRYIEQYAPPRSFALGEEAHRLSSANEFYALIVAARPHV